MGQTDDATTRVGVAGKANRDRYQTLAQGLIDDDSSGLVAQFAQRAQQTLPSTNVFAWKVTVFSSQGQIIGARALAIAKSGGDEVKGLHTYKDDQKDYFARREAFEGMWVDGRKFIYFAVNPGHTGVSRWGRFCLVIDPARMVHEDSAVFPDNTAQRYAAADGTLHADLAREEVACWQSRANVVVKELAEHVPDWASDQWPALICRRERFLEVVTVGPIPLDMVVELRLAAHDARRMSRLALRRRNNQLTLGREKKLADAFIAAKQWPKIELRII